MTTYIPQPYPLWIAHADTTPGCHSVAVERVVGWEAAPDDDLSTLFPVTVGSGTRSPGALVLTDIGGVFAYADTAADAKAEAGRLLTHEHARRAAPPAPDGDDWPEPARRAATR